MAEPIPFPESNFTFTAPAGDQECCELPVFRSVGTRAMAFVAGNPDAGPAAR